MYKGTGAKGGWSEEGVPVGLYRNISTAERVEKERIVLDRDSGSGSEARMEEKGKRQVAKVRLEFAGAVENRTHCGKLFPGELEQEPERCGRRQKETSARECVKMKISCTRGICWRRARTSSDKRSPARIQKSKKKKKKKKSWIMSHC